MPSSGTVPDCLATGGDGLIATAAAGSNGRWPLGSLFAIPGSATVNFFRIAITARNDASGPSTLNALIREGTTNYNGPSGNQTVDGAEWATINFDWTLDPRTGSAWTPAGANSVQGVGMDPGDFTPPIDVDHLVVIVDYTDGDASEGSASGAVAWGGSASGKAIRNGSATGAIGWSGDASGDAPVVPGSGGSASGSVDWGGSAQGRTSRSGSGSGGVAWLGAAAGYTLRLGIAAGSVGWSGAASGEAPTVTDAGGSATGSVGWGGQASGKKIAQGQADGLCLWFGFAEGQAPALDSAEGEAFGAIGWSSAATGRKIVGGSATGSLLWLGSATGPMSPYLDIRIIMGEALQAYFFVGKAVQTNISVGETL